MSARARDPAPLVSCLCVTEDRPAFLPWLLWNYDRQAWKRRELVVVDSSTSPPSLPDRPDVRLIRAPRGAPVAAKRNLALEGARGELLTWFDDDDWQHPEKISHLARALGGRRAFAGCRDSWFVELESGRCSPYRVRGQRVLFNGAVFRTAVARRVRFDERLSKASDTRWMRDLGRARGSSAATVDRPLFFWLCHGANLSNPARKRRFRHPSEAVRRSVGDAAWGDTGEALAALRSRLASGAPAVRVGVVPERPGAARALDERLDAPVSAMVKATTLDAGYLAEMVPHMLRQARYPFVERVVVVDPRREFEGKYRRRADSSRRELDAALDRLLEEREIDRVLEVPYERREIESVQRRYFGRADAPTHATSGGPIYPTLWGMEQLATDRLVQFDADMLFYTDGESWVGRALACMAADPSLWVMMTHPGPPVGPPGRSLAGPNKRRATWDPKLRLWRFRSVSTRFFLADRRRLRGRLRLHGPRGGCLPLEQCIGRALVRHGAFRGDLGSGRSWHVHAFSHAAPFPEWAPRLVEAIEAGSFPRQQAGRYDLRLDRPAERRAWGRLLGRGGRPGSVRAAAVAPVSVVIPLRDRPASRLRPTLASLAWQSSAPLEIRVVSQGSSPEVDAGLAELCGRHGAAFDAIGDPAQPWCKPRALNHGIRRTRREARFVMTLDADMILAPDFLSVVAEHLESAPPPGAMVLCRSRDLPKSARIPADPELLARRFEGLRRLGRLRGRQGCGGIQAAPRPFFFEVRGYDEDFTWWGEEDRDMVTRAERYGLRLVWIEGRTAMLHQWHPHATAAADPGMRRILARALARNRALRRERAAIVVRGNPGWSEAPATP